MPSTPIRQTTGYALAIGTTGVLTLIALLAPWLSDDNTWLKGFGVAYVVFATVLTFCGLFAGGQTPTNISKHRQRFCSAGAAAFGVAGGVAFAWSEVQAKHDKLVALIVLGSLALIALAIFIPRRFDVDENA